MRKSVAFSRRSLSSLTTFSIYMFQLFITKKNTILECAYFQALTVSQLWTFIWSFSLVSQQNTEPLNCLKALNASSNKLNSLPFVELMSETTETGFQYFYRLLSIFFPYSEIYFIKLWFFDSKPFRHVSFAASTVFQFVVFSFHEKIHQF